MRLLESLNLELVEVDLRQEKVAIADAAEEETEAEEEFSELAKPAKSALKLKRKLEVASKVKPEMLIHSTSNPVLEEVLESQTRRRVASEEETGEQSQIVLTREVKMLMEFLNQIIQRRSARQRLMPLKSQRRLKRRKSLKPLLKKLSLVLVSTISLREDKLERRLKVEKPRGSRM